MTRNKIHLFTFLLILIAISFLAVSGPFNTSRFAIETRFGYWAICIILGVLINLPFFVLYKQENSSKLWQIILHSLWSGFFLTFAIYTISHYYLSNISINFMELFGSVLMINTIINIQIFYIHNSYFNKKKSHNRLATTSNEQNILNMLDEENRGEIYLLFQEGHYMQVFTDKAEQMIKISMKKACELMGDKGFRVHKSYWVDFNYIKKVTQNNNKKNLVLTNQKKIPIGNTYWVNVKATLEQKNITF